MRQEAVVLEATDITYLSEHDEKVFFDWLTELRAVTDVSGELRTIRITVVRSRLTDRELRELLAIFTRYRVEMSQLAAFRTRKNEPWFARPTAYWFKSVFGAKRRSKAGKTE